MPNNKRKETGKKLRGNYPRSKLIEAVHAVLRGLCSTADCLTKYGVPGKTVRTYVKYCRDIAAEEGISPLDVEIKDYDGPDRGLSRREEDFLKNFVEDTQDIGVPRCKARLAVDIQQFVAKENLKVPFTNNKPGDSYFERFCGNVDGRPCVLKTPAQVNAFMDRQIILDEWIAGVKEYFKKYNGNLLKDKRLLFVLESQVFKTTTTPIKEMSIVMIYNGCGDIIRWLIVTDRQAVSDECALEQHDSVLLLKTDDGKLSWTVLKAALVLISREMGACGNGETGIVFMDQFIQQHLNYLVWKYTLSQGMYAIAIPRRLCNGQRTFNFGGMAKYNFQMLFLIFQRFVNLGFTMSEKDFIHLHGNEMLNVNFRPTLLASNKFLKLNKVVGRISPLKITDEHEEDLIPIVPVTSTPAIVEKPKKKAAANKKVKKKTSEDVTPSTSRTPATTAIVPNAIDPQNTVTTAGDLPAMLAKTCTVATQTTESSFEQDRYAEARELCLNNTLIREEDF